MNAIQTVRRAFPQGSRAVGAVAAFMLAVLVYVPSMQNGFTYDDVAIITLDERVTTFDLDRIITSGYWRDTTSALYRPLTTITYAVDWQISGGSAAWFHLMNALWHGFVTLLLLFLLHRLGIPLAAAILGAVVFAVHPVHVEAVANIVGRAELLAAAFSLTVALLWLRPPRTLRQWKGLSLLIIGFALALLSKESAIVLPGVLVIADIVRGRLRPTRMRAWMRSRLLPLSVCAVMIGGSFLLRSLLPGGITPLNLDASLEVLDNPAYRFMTALQAWPHYARLLLFPRVLLADYGPRIIMPATGLDPTVLLGLALLALVLLGGVIAWQRGRPWTAGALLWFLITILPVSNLVVPIGVLVAERTLYLPSVALSMGVAATAATLMRRRIPAPTRVLLVTSAAVVLSLLTWRTLARVPDWKSTNTIFAALVRDRPDAFRGPWHFARVHTSRNEHARAAAAFEAAVQLWPYRKRLVQEAAVNAIAVGDAGRAGRLLEFGLERWPDDLILRRLQAGLLLDRGERDSARHHVAQGLLKHPSDSLLLRMMDELSEPSVHNGSQWR